MTQTVYRCSEKKNHKDPGGRVGIQNKKPIIIKLLFESSKDLRRYVRLIGTFRDRCSLRIVFKFCFFFINFNVLSFFSAIVGPWIRDEEVSSKNSEDMISLDSNNVVVIKESGLYLIYAQVRIFVISLELSSSRPKDAHCWTEVLCYPYPSKTVYVKIFVITKIKFLVILHIPKYVFNSNAG